MDDYLSIDWNEFDCLFQNHHDHDDQTSKELENILGCSINSNAQRNRSSHWHNEIGDKFDRMEVSRAIANIIINENSMFDARTTFKIIEELEAHLYKVAPSKESYIDKSTIRERIQSYMSHRRNGSSSCSSMISVPESSKLLLHPNPVIAHSTVLVQPLPTSSHTEIFNPNPICVGGTAVTL
jgi:hypothetical protein